MKRIIIPLLFISSLAYAARNVAAPSAVSVLTRVQVLGSTPTYAGQLVICKDCVNSNQPSGYSLCIGTETSTSNNAYLIVGSSNTTGSTQTACQ